MEYYCEICGVLLQGKRRKLCPECERNPGKTAYVKVEKEKPYEHLAGLKSKCNTTQCKTCGYWNKTQRMCDYYFMTGDIRRCDSPPNCTKYDRNPKVRQTNPFGYLYWGDGVNYESSKNYDV